MTIPTDEHFQESAELFRLLGDCSRAKVFWLLCHSEECVADIAELTGMTSPAISHHLRLLRKSGLIQSSRKGKEVYYKASDRREAALLHHMIEMLVEISCPADRDK